MEVSMMLSTSMDGYISGPDTTKPSTEWTTKEDKKWFQDMSRYYRFLIMGSKTFKTINPDYFLKDRSIIVLTRNAKNEELDTINWDSKPKIYYTDFKPQELIEKLRNRNLMRVMICGGASVYREYLNSGLVDYIYQSICPILMGDGVRFIEGEQSRQIVVMDKRILSSQTMGYKYRVTRRNIADGIKVGDKLFRMSPTCHACQQKGTINAVSKNENEPDRYLFSYDGLYHDLDWFVKEGWIIT